MDYRLGMTQADRARFKKLEATLEGDLKSKTMNCLSLALADRSNGTPSEQGAIAYKSFRAEIAMMCRDERLRSLSAKVEMLGLQFFAEHQNEFELPIEELCRFGSKDNLKVQQEVLKAFPKTETESARKYLALHPSFYTAAKSNFWLPMMGLIEPQNLRKNRRPFYMEKGVLCIKLQDKKTKEYSIKPWEELEKQTAGDPYYKSIPYRLLQRGLAAGREDSFANIEPFREVKSNGRCVFQSVVSLLRKAPFSNPIGISMGNTGHAFSQLVIPQRRDRKAYSDVYAYGFFVKNWNDVTGKPLLTVPGIYKSPDSHVTRIAEKDDRKGYRAVIKEYEFQDDDTVSPCLFAYMNEGDHKTLKKLIDSRNEEGYRKFIERIKTIKKMTKHVPDGFKKEEKGRVLLDFVENHLGKSRDFHALEGNCTVELMWQESFVIDLLDATYHTGEPVRIFPHQEALDDVKYTIFDQIANYSLKLLIALGSIIPGTGIGKSHAQAHGAPMMRASDAIKHPVGRTNTTFTAVAYPKNVPAESIAQKIKGYFQRFINYLRGVELPT